MERRRVELPTSALRTQGQSNVTGYTKRLAETPPDVCTRVCTSEEENANGDLLEVLAAQLRTLSPTDRAKLAEHLSTVYDHFWGGRISKPTTLPEEVIRLAEDLEQTRMSQAVEEALLNCHGTTAERLTDEKLICKILERQATDDDRLRLLAVLKEQYCLHCGRYQGDHRPLSCPCQCLNDA